MVLFVSIDSHRMELVSLLCMLEGIEMLAILAAHLVAMLLLLRANLLNMLAGKLLLLNALRRHFLQRIDKMLGTHGLQGYRSDRYAVISIDTAYQRIEGLGSAPRPVLVQHDRGEASPIHVSPTTSHLSPRGTLASYPLRLPRGSGKR